MKLSIRHAIWCSLFASLTGVSLAASPASPPQRIVNFADLDVAHAAGAAVLYSRIKHAAYEVCQSDDARDLAAFQHARQCQSQAIASAVARINQPELTKHVSNTHGQILIARQP